MSIHSSTAALVKIACFIYILMNINPLQAQDTLYLNNKSVLVGKFKGLELGKIRSNIKDASEVSVEVEKVKTLFVVSYVLEVETRERSYIGYFDVADSGKITLVNIIDTTILEVQDLIKVTTFSRNFWDALSASFGLGYSYTKSSEVGRFNFEGRTNYTQEHVRLFLSGSSIITQDTTSFVRDREQILAGGSYYYNARVFNQVQFNYQRNLQLGLLSRIQEGISIGGRLYAAEKMQLNSLTGVVINIETNTSGENSGLLYEIPLALTYNFYSNRLPDVRFSITEVAYFGIAQNGRVRQDGDGSIAWDFLSDFTLKLSVYHNYDSRPPRLNSSNLDYGFVFNLNYSFN